MRFLLIGLIGFSLAATLEASERVASVSDLAKLETQVGEVVNKAMPATVSLVSEGTGSSGSGVIVSKDGLILTAAHVVQGVKEVDVYFSDGKKWQAKVLGANFSKDIGMAQIKGDGSFSFVELGESKPLVAGDWVVALGHSAGFDPARTPPVRFGSVMSDGPGNYFTTDCTLIGGDSGGPLFDLNSKLVGINSSIGESWKNNNHAGIDGFREDWDRLIAGETWGVLQMNPMANPETPVIGIGMDPYEDGLGVRVKEITPNSPAGSAGVRAGDLILSIDGERVTEGGFFLQILNKKEAGDTVSLGVARADKRLSFDVELVKREDLYKTR